MHVYVVWLAMGSLQKSSVLGLKSFQAKEINMVRYNASVHTAYCSDRATEQTNKITL